MARKWRVFWTWGQQLDVPTKTAGMKRAREWKDEYEAKGWRVSATKGLFPGFNAFSPDSRAEDYNVHGPDAPSHTIIVVELDEREKVIMPPYKTKMPKAVKDLDAKVIRRPGRKPIGA